MRMKYIYGQTYPLETNHGESENYSKYELIGPVRHSWET